MFHKRIIIQIKSPLMYPINSTASLYKKKLNNEMSMTNLNGKVPTISVHQKMHI